MTFHKSIVSIEEIDKRIASGIPSEQLGRYSPEILVHIAQKAGIQPDGLSVIELLTRIRDEATFILPSTVDWSAEE